LIEQKANRGGDEDMLRINQKTKKMTALAVGENIDARTKEVKIFKKEASAEKETYQHGSRTEYTR